MDFKRTQGLKKDSDFRKVYKHGKSFANRNLVMYILDNKSDSTSCLLYTSPSPRD